MDPPDLIDMNTVLDSNSQAELFDEIHSCDKGIVFSLRKKSLC